VKLWARRHPLGSQALVFGIVFPLLMWGLGGITRLSGFPHPVYALGFVAYWLILGGLTGCAYYVVERLIVTMAHRTLGR
jgi:hypothetical protein